MYPLSVCICLLFIFICPFQSRPPGIYKGQYLQELANRYMGGDIGELITPTLPDWCNEEEENSGGEDIKGGPKGKEKAGKGEPNKKKKKSEIENEVSSRQTVILTERLLY